MNKKLLIVLGVAAAAGAAAFFLWPERRADAGPYGGDLVALDDGETYAEVLTNDKTGEVMTHFWEPDLKTPRPIENKPMTIGSEDHRLELMPHPTVKDSAGRCSRFYGQADWVRGGEIHHGWLQRPGDNSERRSFDWKRCWAGGRDHGSMWNEMEQHRRMGMHERQSSAGRSGRHEGTGNDSGHRRGGRHQGTDDGSRRFGPQQGKKNGR